MRPPLVLAAFILVSANAILIAQDAALAAQDAAPAAQEEAPGEQDAAAAPDANAESAAEAPGSPAPREDKRGLAVSGKSWADLAAYAPLGDGFGAGDIAYSASLAARLNIANAKRGVLSLDASLEAGLLYGQAARAQRDLLSATLAGLPPAVQAALDAAGNDFSGVSLEVKKFSLALDLGPASLVLGRQIYNTGRALVFSPADLFTEPDLSGLQAGRKGMDLARLGIAVGERAGCGAVAKPGIDPARGEYALRAYAGLPGIDAALQCARDQEGDGSWILAADLKADLFLGLYGEAALRLPAGGDPALRASAGVDYSFRRELFLRAEYYYNGLSGRETGASDPLAAFPGGHYLYSGTDWVPNEDWALSAFWLGELGGPEGSGTLALSYQAAQNARLTAFLRGGYGDSDYLQAGARMELKY